MSLKVIKAGILDSIQDPGRVGYREYGINVSGSMDVFSGKKANILAGNNPDDAVIELHYPASSFQFTRTASIFSISAVATSVRLNVILSPGFFCARNLWCALIT